MYKKYIKQTLIRAHTKKIHTQTHTHTHTYIYIYTCVCVCVRTRVLVFLLYTFNIVGNKVYFFAGKVLIELITGEVQVHRSS